MELLLLAKINTVFHIAEKVCYGLLGIYGVFIAKRYLNDYKDSVENERRHSK